MDGFKFDITVEILKDLASSPGLSDLLNTHNKDSGYLGALLKVLKLPSSLKLVDVFCECMYTTATDDSLQ